MHCVCAAAAAVLGLLSLLYSSYRCCLNGTSLAVIVASYLPHTGRQTDQTRSG